MPGGYKVGDWLYANEQPQNLLQWRLVLSIYEFNLTAGSQDESWNYHRREQSPQRNWNNHRREFLVLELSPPHMEQSPPLINVNVLASIHEGAVFIVHNVHIWKRVQDFGLVRRYFKGKKSARFIKMLMCLPYLPAEQITPTFYSLQE
ncbi:MAG: hypothetical protein GY774_24555, partial [Planctomycetes bacterium]|nr:hypothetical protein [Planctomycetota bacterium]